MQIDSLTVGIGFKVEYDKLDKLQARLKEINKLWEGITSKKIASLEKGPVEAAKRADNEMAKLRRLARDRNKGMRIAADREEQQKEDANKARLKRIALNNRGIAFLADLDEKRKKEALKEESAKLLDKEDKEREEQKNREKRAHEAVQQMKDLRKGALITAAAVTAAYAAFSKMFEHAADSAQTVRNIMLTTGVDRTTLKNIGYSGESFGLSEKEMFSNVKAILSAQAALTMGGNSAPFATLGLSPRESIETTIKKLRNASQKLDPNIFRQLASQLGASDNFLAWITGGEDLKVPKAFTLSVEEYNQTLRSAEAWNKLLYLMGQFGDKLMSKSGDKLVTVFTAIINMLDLMLKLIDKAEANPVTKKMFGIGTQEAATKYDYAQSAIKALTGNPLSAAMRFMELLNKNYSAEGSPLPEGSPASSASIIGQIGAGAIDKSTTNANRITNSGGNTINNTFEIYGGGDAIRVIDEIALRQATYQMPATPH